MLTLADVIEALTNIRPPLADTIVTEAAVDSRQVIPGGLFVAIPGERVDGHAFVGEAFRRGATLALVQHELAEPFSVLDLRKGFNPESLSAVETPLCIYVEDTLAALQKIAWYWRRKLDLRVVGITGSVGKSTTKEIVAEVLERRYRTLKSPGNLNNEIGLPLTILRLGSGYERAVLEMGFYVPGEITLLCDIALPDIGVVTNIGTVHAERAGSQEAIFEGKSELVQALPADGVAILNYDDPLVKKMAERTRARVLFYGLSPEADIWVDEVTGLGLEGVRFRVHHGKDNFYVRVPMIGQHSVHTALRAAAVGLADGMTWQEIIAGLQESTSQLRLVAVRSASGAMLLDDTYNASPESTLAALNLLAELDGVKVAVLGDMLELGQYEKHGHEIVGIRAAQVAERLISVGARGHMIADAARKAGLKPSAITECDTADEAIEVLQGSLGERDVVLVKGSRGVCMDRIISAIEERS
ncbi:MAG: UDP-N-acetylmuramoyl-tripeptide--D-alanyl-D-alanine ligase [Chloroflexota bacterium]